MHNKENSRKISRRDAFKCMGTLFVGATIAGTPLLARSGDDKPTKAKRLIFFFSATGNSLYIAKELGGDRADLRSISQEVHNANPVYEAEEIGFVCPIHCFIPPAIVQDFIARSSFKADYFFAVGTYGAHSTIFPEFLDNLAKEHGVQMNYISTIQMVDTYLPFFDVERELADPKIQRIPERLAVVLASINKREDYIQLVTEQDRMMCDGYYRMSGRDRQRPTVTRSEKIVFSTDACVGCGVCASVCPHGSWKVIDGKGVPEGECENCLACVHNCPQKAISIIPTPPEPEEPNRNARYRNPNVTLGELIRANCQI